MEEMPVVFPFGDTNLIAPIDLKAGDVLYCCPICGICRVDRDGQTVFTKDHDHKMFIDPADWVVSSGDNHD